MIYALAAGRLFDINEDSFYVRTLVGMYLLSLVSRCSVTNNFFSKMY